MVMTILWFNLVFVYIFSTIARYFAKPTLSDIGTVKPAPLFVFFALVTMVIVAGLQNNIGDTFFYMHAYALNEYSLEDLKTGKDVGFTLLQFILQQFSRDPQILIIVTAIITNVL